MASFVKYDQFVEDLGLGVHNLNTDTLKIALTNTLPVPGTHAVRADITEIAAGNGYVSGGNVVASNAYSQSGGTGSLTGTDVVFTASGGNINQFRYAVLYNDTPTGPVDPLIGYWDNGSAVDLTDGSSFTVDFGATILQLT